MNTVRATHLAMVIIVAIVAVGLIGCDSEESSTDTMAADTAVADTSAPVDIPAAEVSCSNVSFGKFCASDADCFVALQTSDCCGTVRAIGLNTSSQANFEATEAACGIEPICDCLPMETRADDGNAGATAAVGVRCEAAACTTFIADAGVCDGVIPAVDKACTADADCDFGFHQIDCCGTAIAIGFNTASRTDFDSAEAACRATYPGCGCPELPPQAESGQIGTIDTIAVACSNNTCSTLVQ